ncbi:MAG: hypothetical protein IJ594_07770, partial [Oscillospiraceae bacterium]|nr:hypothetical protein [Oscillospiraceae bacterium]
KIERTGRALGYMRPRCARVRPARALLIAALIAAFLALGVTAYAALSGGIRELWPALSAAREPFPVEAADDILPQEQSAQAAGWTCRITETYCDDTRIVITARVTCTARYLPVPTDADPDLPAAYYGFDGDGTLGEYAAAKGKELLLMNLGVQDERIGEIGAGIHFENVSDSELLILHDGQKSRVFDSLETSCTVVAQAAESGTLERVGIPLVLTAGSSRTLGVYRPADPDAAPGLRAGEATLTETPLGLCLQYPVEVTDPAAEQTVLFLACEEIDFRGTGGLGFTAADGTTLARLTMGDGAPGDKLTVRYYDGDKQPVGELIFLRVEDGTP